MRRPFTKITSREVSILGVALSETFPLGCEPVTMAEAIKRMSEHPRIARWMREEQRELTKVRVEAAIHAADPKRTIESLIIEEDSVPEKLKALDESDKAIHAQLASLTTIVNGLRRDLDELSRQRDQEFSSLQFIDRK